MLRRNVATLAATTVVLATLAGPAPAQQTFAKTGQTIRAGVVILESDRPGPGAEPVNRIPHLWFNLDSNKSVKPAGWTFVNPLAQTQLSIADRNRWFAIEATLPTPGTTPFPGAFWRLTKRTAPYWEVRLNNVSDAQLANYDVLVVAPAVNVQLNPSDREKLRRFVDRGGILWIDPSGLPTNALDEGNSFPVPFRTITGANSAEFRDASHPLINGPQPLSLRDLTVLSSAPASNFRDLVPPGPISNDLALMFGESFFDFVQLKPVVGISNAQFSVGVGRIGDGFVVVTSRGTAYKLNRVRSTLGYGYNTNSWYGAKDPNLEVDGIAAAKFAVNMISLAREFNQQHGGSQRSSSSAVDVGAPLLYRAADTEIAGSTAGPVLYKGLLVTSAGGVIRVYDADPARDFDGDGILDDGAPDGGVEGRDLIWESTDVGATLSTPVCVEVPNSQLQRPDGSRIIDQVLATDSQGRLHAFDLIRYNANGTVNGDARGDIPTSDNRYPASAPAGSGTIHVIGLPNPPTVHENFVYVVDQINSGAQGRLWMVDLMTGFVPRSPVSNREWYMGGNAGVLPPFSSMATVGYIPILDNSGGMDKVLYAPTALIPASSGAAQPAGFVSLWLGVKGEKPTDYEPKAGNTAPALTVTTRAAREGLPIYLPSVPDSRAVRLTLLRSDGSVYTPAQVDALFDGPPTQAGGILTFNFASGFNALPNDVTGIRVDYTIDYGFGTGGEIANARRGDVFLPDRTTPTREIRGPVALSPKGTIYLTTSGGGRAAIYGFREEGRGAFRCVMRYELYGAHAMGGQGLADQRIPPVFIDGDPTQNFAPAFLSQPFTSFEFLGPPAVRGDVVYAAVRAVKGLGVDTTVLMAFRAEPETPTIYVENFPANGAIVQPDLARSVTLNRPEVQTTFQVGQTPGMTYDEETKLLRIENLATSPKGQLQAVLNLSQPILIRTPGGGSPDRFLYPNGASGANRFDPLLWFTVLNGYRPSRAGLVVTGNTLFMAGASPLRNILVNGTLASEGMLYALDVDINSGDASLAPMAGRPWISQLYQLTMTGSVVTGVNPHQKWPQLAGVQDFDDYLVRLNQTIIPGSTSVEAIAAGEGVLAVVGNQGLFTFSRSDFLVADQGRIAAFDPAGNPTFEMTATGSGGENDLTNAGTANPIVRPSRAYPLPNNEILVADPGANRVFRVNRAGTETRAISRFRLDPRKAPPNYPANGPLTLNGPRDVVTYTTIENATSVEQFFTPSGAQYEYWSHYLIADSGNRRLVEVVDRFAYDPVNRRIGDVIQVDGQPQMGVLLWHSPTATQGKGYEYNSLSRVFVDGRYVYFAGIGNALPTSTDTGGQPPTPGSLRDTAGFGGVAVFDPALPNGVAVFSRIQVPGTGANVFWNEATGAFDSPARPARTQPLVNVTSVTTRPIRVGNSTQLNVMITDANGVWEVVYGTPPAMGEYAPNVVWMMPNEVYRVMRRAGTGNGVPIATNPRDLRATYARRLESGEVLIVNGYFGQTRGTRNADGTFSGRQPFRGEVVQVSGTSGDLRLNSVNMGFGIRSITFNLELVSDARGLVQPVFADRR